MPVKASHHNHLVYQLNLLDKPDLPCFEQRKTVSLYNEGELMRNVADYVCECLLSMGFVEDNYYTNIRIGFSGVACLIALYPAFLLQFPEQTAAITACIVAFFILLFVLFCTEAFIVKHAMISVKDKYGKRMFVDGRIDTLESTLELGVRQGERELSYACFLGECFDSDGFMVTDRIFAELARLLKDFDEAEKAFYTTGTHSKEDKANIKKIKKRK